MSAQARALLAYGREEYARSEKTGRGDFFFEVQAYAGGDATDTLHNILTLRGAKVRDALAWSRFLQQTIDMFGPNIDSEFASHHWPMWGNARIIDFLKKQRDLYKPFAAARRGSVDWFDPVVGSGGSALSAETESPRCPVTGSTLF